MWSFTLTLYRTGPVCSMAVLVRDKRLQGAAGWAGAIDLFSLYILFSHFRPHDATWGNSFFQMSSYGRANLRITNEKTKGKFPWGHHVVWNGKTKCTNWKGLFLVDLPRYIRHIQIHEHLSLNWTSEVYVKPLPEKGGIFPLVEGWMGWLSPDISHNLGLSSLYPCWGLATKHSPGTSLSSWPHLCVPRGVFPDLIRLVQGKTAIPISLLKLSPVGQG